MTARRRILIVDDEIKVAFFLQESLKALGHDFEVVGVSSTKEALKQTELGHFDLLVADQRMPEMSGLELIRQVQASHPDTRSILITAYGTEDTFAQAQQLGAFRYFTKPFHIEDFVQTVLDALGEDRAPLSEQPADALSGRLEELRREAGAQCVVACDSSGQSVAQAGSEGTLDLAGLLSITADAFDATLRLNRLLGGNQVNHLIYLESADYDLYLAHVHDDLFLVIVFDRFIQASRIGIVWLYARRAIEHLRRLYIPDTFKLARATTHLADG